MAPITPIAVPVKSKAKVSWVAPLVTVDINHWSVKLGAVSGIYTQSADMPFSYTSAYILDLFPNLPTGTYFIAVTSVNVSGQESVPSPEASFTLAIATPDPPLSISVG